MLQLGSRFDYTYCLSVDYRYEKEKERIQKLLIPYGIYIDTNDPEHWPNGHFFIDGKGEQLPMSWYNQISPSPPPTWQDGEGSYAHFRAFKKMIGGFDGETLLVVEDDLVLTPDFEEVATKALEQLPDDWDMFYFGANHSGHRTREISPNILRCFGSACTHMVAFRRPIYDAILELPEDRTIDWNIANRLHHKFCCYAAWPNSAIQRPGYSLLWKRQVDYSDLWKNKGEAA